MDHICKGVVSNKFIGTDFQIVDIFTKLLFEDRFYILRSKIGMLDQHI